MESNDLSATRQARTILGLTLSSEAVTGNAEEEIMPIGALTAHMTDMGAAPADTRQYLAAMTTARDVIAAIDARRPGLSDERKHNLLFFAQGHHLVDIGVPLYAEPMYVTDRGVIVDLIEESDSTEPDNDQLNTVSYVLHRYGDMYPADLITLVTAATPWQLARGTDDGRVEWAWLADWFRRPAELNAEGRPTAAQFAAADAAFLAGRKR